MALEQYLPLFSLLALVILFAGLSFVASTFLGPRRPTAAKQAPDECGIVPEVEPVERFSVKFYVVARLVADVWTDAALRPGSGRGRDCMVAASAAERAIAEYPLKPLSRPGLLRLAGRAITGSGR